MGYSALAAPSCFVGVLDWRVAQMLHDFVWDNPVAGEVLRWIVIVLGVAYLYFVVVLKLWNLLLSKRGEEWDKRDKEEQAIDDEEQLRDIKRWEQKRREKKERKRKK